MTALPDLPPDPEPRPADLEPFLADWSSAPSDLQVRGATLSWRLDRQKRDPNGFLVPFVASLEQLVPGFDYNEYRKGALWRAIRKRVLTAAGHTCAGCGARAKQVHHRDYRPRVMSGEDLRPLVAICKTCHDEVERARKEIGWHAGEAVLADLVERQASLSSDSA
jgi:hypothetical protein